MSVLNSACHYLLFWVVEGILCLQCLTVRQGNAVGEPLEVCIYIKYPVLTQDVMGIYNALLYISLKVHRMYA